MMKNKIVLFLIFLLSASVAIIPSNDAYAQKAINWKTVQGVRTPNFGAEFSLLDKSSNRISGAIEGLADTGQEALDQQVKLKSEEFIAHINSLGSDEERKQAFQEAPSAFLDQALITAGIKQANVDDRATEVHESQQEAHDLLQRTNLGDLEDQIKQREIRDALYKANTPNRELALKNKATRLEAAAQQLEFDKGNAAVIEENEDIARAAATQQLEFDKGNADYEQKTRIRKRKLNESNREKVKTQLALFSGKLTTENYSDNIANFTEAQKLNNQSEVSPEQSARLSKVENKLIRQTTKSLESGLPSRIASVIGKDISGVSDTDYTSQMRIDLIEDIASEYQSKFVNMPREDAEKLAEKIITRDIGVSYKFAESAKKVTFKQNLKDKKTERLAQEEDDRQVETRALNNNPEVYIYKVIFDQLSKHPDAKFDQDLRGKLRLSITQVYEKLQAALPNLSEEGKEQLNRGVLDIFRQTDIDHDFADWVTLNDENDDFVLAGTVADDLGKGV